MWLDTLEIKNYKSHKDTTLKFSEGLTLLVGKSQSGKSAALEALELVATNSSWKARWLYGQKEKGTVRITSTFKDKYAVKLIKKINKLKTDTAYKIYYVGRRIFDAKKVGRTLPEEVSRLINFGTPNLQKQDDQSFLVNSSKGEVSREVGDFIGINSVQVAIRDIATEISKVKTEIRIVKEEEKVAEEEIQRYKKLKEVKMLQVVYERTMNELEEMRSELDKLEEYVSEVPVVKKQILEIEKTLGSVDELLVGLSRKYQEEGNIRDKIDEYQRFIEVDTRWRKVEQEYQKVRKKIMKVKVCPLCLSTLTRDQLQELLK